MVECQKFITKTNRFASSVSKRNEWELLHGLYVEAHLTVMGVYGTLFGGRGSVGMSGVPLLVVDPEGSAANEGRRVEIE